MTLRQDAPTSEYPERSLRSLLFQGAESSVTPEVRCPASGNQRGKDTVQPHIKGDGADLLMKSPPSIISLAGGAPNPDTFPFKSASITLTDGTAIEIGENLMKKALQYSATPGYIP
ncbi:unnamed protein product [Ranitomeya imitator]|uniref:Uncharacterized protein n=1 Tax=Ranitomeya imitator TaxID=111125 RepID=A0ABN9LAK7_9NEOB|nr:unnamed protein product [Ranitomeya imitator]